MPRELGGPRGLRIPRWMLGPLWMGGLHAMVGVAAAEETTAGATVSTNLRLSPTGSWLDFRDGAVFSPWASAAPSAQVRARGAVDLRLHNLADFDTLDAASDPAQSQPWSLRFVDAWVAARGEHLTVKLGAQRIAWGVGSGISVVDNLNPIDLEDPTRFDARLSVPAIHSQLSAGSLALEAAWVPFFTPAAMPASGVSLTAGAADLFDAEATGAGAVEINTLQTRLTLPDSGLLSGAVGGRARWSGARADAALSWYSGRDSLPQVSGEVLLTGFQTDSARVDVGIPMLYPRIDIGGLEVKGELLGGSSGWAEVALVLPSATSAAPSAAQLESLEKLGTIEEVPDPIPTTVTQDGQPYARWLVGLDRSVGPVYLNAQWLHGFPTERQGVDLRDYALLAARWSITPVVRLDLSGASDGAGWMAGGALRWLHGDALELSAGYVGIGGPPESALSSFSSVSHGRLGAEVVF